MSRGSKNFEVHDRKILDGIEKILGRNIDIKGYSDESSGGI